MPRRAWIEMPFPELNNDQRREVVNTRQRFEAWQNAAGRDYGYRGSMTWAEINGIEYLVRSYYDEKNVRRQKSLGRRDVDTEALKARFDDERQQAAASRKNLDQALDRQAAVNRALRLGRVPVVAARILRLLDKRGLLGSGIRVVGTNALYAYEAECGITIDPEVTATGDIDLLFDSRRRLFLLADPELDTPNLVELLRFADRSFSRTKAPFRAQNDDGYFVDLIKPQRNPPWLAEKTGLGDQSDLQAAEIEGLAWLENAPAFEQIAIDERGFPLRIVAPDPRVFAIHKIWISSRENRDPIKKQRDQAQARAIAEVVRQYMLHLPFNIDALRMLPRNVAQSAMHELGIAATAEKSI